MQILLLLAISGITTGFSTRTVVLATSLTLCHQFSSQLIQDPQQVAKQYLILQGQIDSLAVVVLQNHQGLVLIRAEEGVFASSSKKSGASILTSQE